jgi:hypothetical protein
MSIATLWILAVVLAFPLQVLVLVVAQLSNDVENSAPSPSIGPYVCTNFVHGSTPFRCNLGRLVSNAVEGALLIDILSMGLMFILSVLAAALLLLGLRILHLKLWSRPNNSFERTRER